MEIQPNVMVPKKNAQDKVLEFSQRILTEHKKNTEYFHKMEVIDKAYAKTLELLQNNKSKLDILAATLLEKEVIYKEDLERVFGKRTWDKEENEKLVNVPVEEVIAIKAEEKPSQENSPA